MTVGPDVDQAPGEAPGQLSAPVLDALAGQLDQRKSDREAEARRAAAHGGPCAYCGAVESWERPGVLGRWHTDYGRPCCVPSARDGELLGGGIAGAGHPPGARPGAGPPWAGHRAEPAARFWYDGPLVERTGFRWWFETTCAGTVALSDHPVRLPPLRRSKTTDHGHGRVVRPFLGTLP
jgi:hypothetical protein